MSGEEDHGLETGLYVFAVVICVVFLFFSIIFTNYWLFILALIVPINMIICTGVFNDRFNNPNEEVVYSNSTSTNIQRTRNVSARTRVLVLERDNYTCQMCGRTRYDGVKLEVDHIIPVSKGGSDDISNLRTLCFDCNRGKSDKILKNYINK